MCRCTPLQRITCYDDPSLRPPRPPARQVAEESSRESVDAGCRKRTASWVRDRAAEGGGSAADVCSFYEALEEAEGLLLPAGIYTLADLRAHGRAKGVCPYFLARRVLATANVVVYSYQYLLDPKVSQQVRGGGRGRGRAQWAREGRLERSSPPLSILSSPFFLVSGGLSAPPPPRAQVSRDLEKECIVVFDEAHNIDNVAIEALSVNLRSQTLEVAGRNLGRLTAAVDRMKDGDR